MELLGYLAILLMGIVLGVMGGGGSILTLPIMVYLFGFSPTAATGYSLFVVGLSALIGSAIYISKGDIDFKAGLFFAIPSIIGVNLSRGLIIPSLPDVVMNFQKFVITKEIVIMTIFALLMMGTSYSMIKAKKKIQSKSELTPSARKIVLVTEGLIVGLVVGFVGAGGGFLITPALVLLAGLAMRVAIGTSLMVIALQSLLGFAGDVLRGSYVEWSQLRLIASVAVVGIILGSALAHKIKEQQLKITFGWFVLIMGIAILSEQFSRLTF